MSRHVGQRRAHPLWAVAAAMLAGVAVSFVAVACNPGEGGNATPRPTTVPRP